MSKISRKNQTVSIPKLTSIETLTLKLLRNNFTEAQTALQDYCNHVVNARGLDPKKRWGISEDLVSISELLMPVPPVPINKE